LLPPVTGETHFHRLADLPEICGMLRQFALPRITQRITRPRISNHGGDNSGNLMRQGFNIFQPFRGFSAQKCP
jgi:hypothetical protein